MTRVNLPHPHPHRLPLDKTLTVWAAVDFVQENVLGQGQQNNESAAEQAKDEAVSDYIRSTYKGATGQEFIVEDKDKKYGM